LTDRKDHEQFVIDIPEVRPTVTRYVTHSRQCAQCGQRVRSHHPEQISEATGAAGVVIGPRAKALAADLKHRLGVPYGKVAEVLDLGFGLPISRGGLCQADARLAEQARPVYVELLDLIRQSAVAHVDETGWRIGTLSAWLSVFTNRDHKPSLPPADFAVQAAELEARLDALIDSRRQLTDADNARFAKRLRKHRAHLLRFLYVEGLDATNHQAERMLRPAVITRKTGGCNRTEGGAESHSILTSVLVTCRQQGFSLLDSLIQIQRNLGSTLESLAPPLLDTS
jgi:transposase